MYDVFARGPWPYFARLWRLLPAVWGLNFCSESIWRQNQRSVPNNGQSMCLQWTKKCHFTCASGVRAELEYRTNRVHRYSKLRSVVVVVRREERAEAVVLLQDFAGLLFNYFVAQSKLIELKRLQPPY